jgi:hypothetical protein
LKLIKMPCQLNELRYASQDHMTTSIPACAREYAKYWISKERAFVAALASGDYAVRLQALQRAAGYFRVARTMRLAYDVGRGQERLGPALAVLQEAPFQRVTAANLSETVGLLRRRLGEVYGDRDLLSAATKLLWLLHRDAVVIFDSQARVSLRTAPGDYDAYLASWRLEFAKAEPDIRQACGSLSDQVRADSSCSAPQLDETLLSL